LDWVDIQALGRHRQDHRTAKTDVTLGTEYRIRVSQLRLRRSALSFEHSLDPLEPLDFGPDRLSLAPSWAWASLLPSASPPHACSHHRSMGDGRSISTSHLPSRDLVLLLLPPLLGSVNLNLYLWLALMHLQPSQCWNPLLFCLIAQWGFPA
jgi:hypothetical protein